MELRKGFLLTVDVILASVLFLAAIFLFMSGYNEVSDTFYAQRLSEDIISSLNAITIAEYAQHYPDVLLLLEDTLLEPDDSLLYAMSMLWVLEDSRIDSLSNSLQDHLPDDVWMSMSFQGSLGVQEVYSQIAPVSDKVRVVASQQVTGIDRGQPVAGSSSTAYLTRLRDKQTRSFAYFGGFVGQGDITVLLDLPPDVSGRMVSLVAELDTPQEFTLFVNGVECGVFTPVSGVAEPDSFDLSGCIPHVVGGINSFRLEFVDLTTAYVAGGFIRALYTTDTFTTNPDLTATTYLFPEIVGVANLYDAFSVPAPITEVEVYLRYQNPDPTANVYLAFGEIVVYESNATGVVTVTLSNQDLLDAGVDYARFENTTIPLRFAAFNAYSETVTGGNADVVLVTDYTASMMKSVFDWSQGNVGGLGNPLNCPDVYALAHIRRTHLARCLSSVVVDILFEGPGNRLWPVNIRSNNIYSYTANPENINNELFGYYVNHNVGIWGPGNQGSGRTCISCALAEAHSIFSAQDAARPKFVILMSDGLPTHCSGAGCELGLSSSYGQQYCEGLCDVSGQNCNQFATLCSDYSCGPAMDDAKYAAQRLVDDFGATIYTIGFGPVIDCPNAMEVLLDIATIGSGTYQHSSDPDDLLLIYENISREILTQLELVSQTVIVPGDITPSTLFGDSTITVTHQAPIADIRPNEIEITRQTPPFGSCNPTISLPEGVRYRSAQLLSYSGPHWTDRVVANGQEAFNLLDYLVDYSRLGDPFMVGIPVQFLSPQTQFSVRIADAYDDPKGCSDDNSLVYTVFVPSATARTPVLEEAEGCVWTIETEIDTQVVAIPKEYVGSNVCSYTSTNISYDLNDAMQVAVYELLSSLDFDDSGIIFLSLEAEDLEIIVNRVAAVPYLWGPIRFSVEVRS